MRVWRAGVAVVAALGMAQQAPVIRVPVRLVTVPTLVFSSEGRLVGGLQKSDFRLFDNGHPQRLTVDLESTPVSIAAAVQANLAVRDYVPFVAKTGNLIDALLAGENGESALVTYGDDVRVVKPFDSGELSTALKKVSPSGRSSRMLDAASRAIDMLKGRPASHA